MKTKNTARPKNHTVRSILLIFFTSAFLLSCDNSLPVSIECNGKEVAQIHAIAFEPKYGEGGNGMLSKVGIKVIESNGIEECCAKRTWRQWFRPDRSYVIGGGFGQPPPITREGGVWVADKDPNDTTTANLEAFKPDTNKPEESPFEQIKWDFPRNALDGLEMEFVTCFGCVNANGYDFRPLACFTWGFAIDGNEVDIDTPERLDADDFDDLELPQSGKTQSIPANPPK